MARDEITRLLLSFCFFSIRNAEAVGALNSPVTCGLLVVWIGALAEWKR